MNVHFRSPLSHIRLGEIAEFIHSVTYKPADVSNTSDPNAIACMRTKNIQADLEDDDLVFIPRLPIKQGKILHDGDILVSSANSWNLVGKCCWVPKLPYQATFGGFTSVLRVNTERVFPRYLYHWFRTDRTQQLARSFGQQTTNISNLNLSRCLELEVLLPSLDEQRRIAGILDKADQLRRKRSDAYDLIEELSDAIFVSMFGPCQPGSAAWPMSVVSVAGKVQLGRQRAPKYQTGEFTKPYVRVANVYEDRIDTADILQMDFNENDFRDYKLEYGDILLNEGQSTELVGRPAMWRSEIKDCCFQNTLVRFQANLKYVVPEFALALFLRYFRSGEFARISSKTSSVAHLGAGRFGVMPFPLPPLKLQRKFADYLVGIGKLKDKHRTGTKSSKELFSSLQSRAFSGEF